MQKATLALVLVFGALTLGLHDERFIKWKPTVLYTGMALGLAAALWGWKKNVLQLLLGSQLRLPAAVWNRLTLAWVLYFIFMAASNAFVAHFYSTETWMDFKLWGYVFPLLFIVGQGLYVAPYLKDEHRS
jgi:intracellular septation protein